jgi:hypothetical protein
MRLNSEQTKTKSMQLQNKAMIPKSDTASCKTSIPSLKNVSRKTQSLIELQLYSIISTLRKGWLKALDLMLKEI